MYVAGNIGFNEKRKIFLYDLYQIWGISTYLRNSYQNQISPKSIQWGPREQTECYDVANRRFSRLYRLA